MSIQFNIFTEFDRINTIYIINVDSYAIEVAE